MKHLQTLKVLFLNLFVCVFCGRYSSSPSTRTATKVHSRHRVYQEGLPHYDLGLIEEVDRLLSRRLSPVSRPGAPAPT